MNDFRKSFINYLELLSSDEKLRKYKEEVPIADVPAEIVCMWFDDLYTINDEIFNNAFSQKERQLLKEFNDYFALRVEKLSNNFDSLMQSIEFIEIRQKALEILKFLKT